MTRQRRRRPRRVRTSSLRQTEQVNERAAAGARADAAHELRRRRRPPAANPRAVPRGSRRPARHGRRAVRRVEARQRDRADRPDARALLRRRRLEARGAARPDAAELADAPVPRGDQRRVQGASRSGSWRSRRPPPPVAPSVPGPRRRARTSRTLLDVLLGDLARGAGDLLDRTGTETGALLKSKKGDFVITIDPRVARGCGPAGRRRGEGPPDVDARDPRGAARGARRTAARRSAWSSSARRTRRAAIAPFAIVGDGRLLRRRSRRRPTPPRSRRRSGWRACWPWQRSTSTRSRWTPLPSARP